jgi:tetratricopeptide (TPR) repeat protein
MRLHKRLEAYRLPKHLLGVAGIAGSDGRLGQVFRDQEDLPAAQDLAQSVKKALAASNALVVLCSPDAKASPWVTRELELFRELHPDKPILAALLSGEPEDAFPPSLYASGEPLAADLRKHGDGPRLGFLKIVAGIAGVPLDALVQRDGQRQLRRVTAITGLAAAIALLMSFMTVIAIQSRNEAIAQRAEAEGLIEFMLTDLREELKGVGRLDVLSGVNERALEYYEREESLDTLSPESLERRARAIGKLGEDAQSRKDYQLAMHNFEERFRTTEALLHEAPTDQNRMFDHALSLNRLAVLASEQGDVEEVKKRLGQSWILLSKIEAWNSSDLEWLRAVTLVAGNFCAIDAIGQTLSEGSLQHCNRAVSIGRQLSGLEGEASLDPYNLAFNLMWQGDALSQSGAEKRSSDAFNEAMDLIDQLANKHPSHLKIQSGRMEIYAHIARFQTRLIKQKMLAESIAIAEELAASDPKNQHWRSSLESYQNRIGEMK